MDPILHKLFMAGAKRKEHVFVAVGPGGLVATSPDGLVWTSQTPAAVRDWNSVCFGDGKFVAVAGSGGSGSRVMTSPDGVTWTAHTLTNGAWNKVAWGVNSFGTKRFVTVGTNTIYYSADGQTWSAGSGFSNSTWQSVAIGGTGIAVAVASAGTERIHTSSDGNTWADRTEPSVSEWRDVCFHAPASKFIAEAAVGTSIDLSTSASGASWTKPLGAGGQSMDERLQRPVARCRGLGGWDKPGDDITRRIELDAALSLSCPSLDRCDLRKRPLHRDLGRRLLDVLA